MIKKVLFISFYWPPSGKASLQWPLDMVAYLSGLDWDVTVLTVKGDTFSDVDDTFTGKIPESVRIHRTNFWDPFIVYKNLIGKGKGEKLDVTHAVSAGDNGFSQKLSLWIRMNLFVPDARVGWYFPGIREARRIFKAGDFDLIVSNGPPHSTHLLAKKLSKLLGIPLVTVFIDPWVDISYYKNQRRNKLVMKLDRHFEKTVLKESKKAIFVTQGLVDYFEKKYSFLGNKTELLYWGYNEEYFNSLPDNIEIRENLIVHAGNIYDHQDIPLFWDFIRSSNLSGLPLKLRFVGNVAPGVRNSIKRAGIENYAEYSGFLRYEEVILEMKSADHLLVCCSEPRHVPGKLFEYMRTGRPIIAFGDDNKEVEGILSKTNSGLLLSYNENGERFFSELPGIKTDLKSVREYDRREIARKLAEILKNI